MTLQTSGPISHQDIEDELDGSHPIGMDEYYGIDELPVSGEISMSDFYGMTNIVAWPDWNPSANSFTGYTGPSFDNPDSNPASFQVLRLSDTLFVCVYVISGYVYVKAYAMDFDTIAASGSSVSLDMTEIAYNFSCDRISDTSFAVIYNYYDWAFSGDRMQKMCICNVSGTSITAGNKYSITDGTTLTFGIVTINYLAGVLVASYTNDANYSPQIMRAYTFSGTSITGSGSSIAVSSWALYYTNPSPVVCNSSQILMYIMEQYQNSGSYYYRHRLITLSGTTLVSTDLENHSSYFYRPRNVIIDTDIVLTTDSSTRLMHFNTASNVITDTAATNPYSNCGFGFQQHSLEDGHIIIPEERTTGFINLIIYKPTSTTLGPVINQSGNIRSFGTDKRILSSCVITSRIMLVVWSNGTGGTELILIPSLG